MTPLIKSVSPIGLTEYGFDLDPPFDTSPIVETSKRLWRQVFLSYSKVDFFDCEFVLRCDWDEFEASKKRAWSRGLIDEPFLTDEQIWIDGITDGPPYPVRCQLELSASRKKLTKQAMFALADEAAWRLKTEIFLCQNLAVPGSCFLDAVYPIGAEEWVQARLLADQLEWPPMVDLSVSEIASWLQMQKIRCKTSGRTAPEKTLFALLYIGRAGFSEHDRLLWTQIALESMFKLPSPKNRQKEDETARLMSQLVIRDIGHSTQSTTKLCKEHLAEFYRRRNSLVHNAGEVIAPRERESARPPSEDEAFVLALVLSRLLSAISDREFCD